MKELQLINRNNSYSRLFKKAICLRVDSSYITRKLTRYKRRFLWVSFLLRLNMPLLFNHFNNQTNINFQYSHKVLIKETYINEV